MQLKYGWLAALVVASTSTAAFASGVDSPTAGFYFGTLAGQASYDMKKSDQDDQLVFFLEENGATVLSGESDLDKKDTTFNAFAGYRFNPYVAMEAAYLNLGKSAYDAEGVVFIPGVGTGVLNANINYESKGFAVSGLGIWPVSEAIDLYARLGVFFSDTKGKVSLNGVSDSISGKDEDLFYGVGAGWNIGANWTVRLEYQQFDKVGKKSKTGEADVDAMTLGVVFRM